MEISEENYGFKYYGETSIPKTFLQSELRDLIRDLDLSKERAELLASRKKIFWCKNYILSHKRTKLTTIFLFKQLVEEMLLGL